MNTSTLQPRPGIKLSPVAILLAAILMLSALQSYAEDFIFPQPQPEKPVNDIPFDTHEIAVNYHFNKAMAHVSLPVESYVDDIPFETAVVVAKIKDTQADQSEPKKAALIPGHMKSQLNQFMKAGLVSVAILLTVSILSFIYFSYVY